MREWHLFVSRSRSWTHSAADERLLRREARSVDMRRGWHGAPMPSRDIPRATPFCVTGRPSRRRCHSQASGFPISEHMTARQCRSAHALASGPWRGASVLSGLRLDIDTSVKGLEQRSKGKHDADPGCRESPSGEPANVAALRGQGPAPPGPRCQRLQALHACRHQAGGADSRPDRDRLFDAGDRGDRTLPRRRKCRRLSRCGGRPRAQAAADRPVDGRAVENTAGGDRTTGFAEGFPW